MTTTLIKHMCLIRITEVFKHEALNLKNQYTLTISENYKELPSAEFYSSKSTAIATSFI